MTGYVFIERCHSFAHSPATAPAVGTSHTFARTLLATTSQPITDEGLSSTYICISYALPSRRQVAAQTRRLTILYCTRADTKTSNSLAIGGSIHTCHGP